MTRRFLLISGAPRLHRAGLLALGLGLAGLLAACDPATAPTALPMPTPTPLPRGAEVFANYCQVCHPGGNRGVGPRLIGAPFTDMQIKTVVRRGKANMPAFDTQHISDEDLQSLLDYIHALK